MDKLLDSDTDNDCNSNEAEDVTWFDCQKVEDQEEISVVDPVEKITRKTSVMLVMPNEKEQVFTVESSSNETINSILQEVRKYLKPIKVSRLDIYEVMDRNYPFDYVINADGDAITNGKYINTSRSTDVKVEINNKYSRKEDHFKNNGQLLSQSFCQLDSCESLALDNLNETSDPIDNYVKEEYNEIRKDDPKALESDILSMKSIEKIKKSENETELDTYKSEEPELIRTDKENIYIPEFEPLHQLSSLDNCQQSHITIESEDSPTIDIRNSPESSKSHKNRIHILAIYPPPPMKQGIAINTKDYKRLQRNKFLNDIIIDFYLKYLFHEILSSEDRDRTYIFSSHFFTRLANPQTADNEQTSKAEERHAGVQRWTKNVNIFKKDFIIVPVNENHHWFLAIICFPNLVGSNGLDRSNCLMKGDELQKPCILIFDSLSGGKKGRVATILRGYLYHEHAAKMGSQKSFSCDEMALIHPEVPQQRNATDCGLYVLQYVESFFKNPIKNFAVPFKTLSNWFYDGTIQSKRKSIATLIAKLARDYHNDPNVSLPDLTFSKENESYSCSIVQLDSQSSLTNGELLCDNETSPILKRPNLRYRSILKAENNQGKSTQDGELLFDLDASPLRSEANTSDSCRRLCESNKLCYDVSDEPIYDAKSPSPYFNKNITRQYSKKNTSKLFSAKKSFCELEIIRSGSSENSRFLQNSETTPLKDLSILSQTKRSTQDRMELARSLLKRKKQEDNTKAYSRIKKLSLSNSTEQTVPANASADPFYNLSFEALQNDSKLSPSMSYTSFLKFKKKKLPNEE